MRSLVLVCLIVAIDTHISLAKLTERQRCPSTCQLDYKPFCAIRTHGPAPSRCTFINLCTLEMYICKTKQKWFVTNNDPCRLPTPNCYEIMLYFRNNTKLLTYPEDEEDYNNKDQ